MSNLNITFEAIRNLVTGINEGDDITISVPVSEFNRDTVTKSVENLTMDGRQFSSKFYNSEFYNVKMLDVGTVILPDTSVVPLTTAYTEMFLYSVDNSETFTITDIDRSDEEVEVKRTGSFSRDRVSSVYLDRFYFSFRVRKELG